MPLEQQTTSSAVFRITIANAEGALGLDPGSSAFWSYDGENIVTQLQPGPPETGGQIPNGFERIKTNTVRTTWESIRLQFFDPEFPPEVFSRMSVSNNATHVLFNLNNREFEP
jgi:hypothetical protein